jgi:hypothetical protein
MCTSAPRSEGECDGPGERREGLAGEGAKSSNNGRRGSGAIYKRSRAGFTDRHRERVGQGGTARRAGPGGSHRNTQGRESRPLACQPGLLVLAGSLDRLVSVLMWHLVLRRKNDYLNSNKASFPATPLFYVH